MKLYEIKINNNDKLVVRATDNINVNFKRVINHDDFKNRIRFLWYNGLVSDARNNYETATKKMNNFEENHLTLQDDGTAGFNLEKLNSEEQEKYRKILASYKKAVALNRCYHYMKHGWDITDEKEKSLTNRIIAKDGAEAPEELERNAVKTLDDLRDNYFYNHLELIDDNDLKCKVETDDFVKLVVTAFEPKKPVLHDFSCDGLYGLCTQAVSYDLDSKSKLKTAAIKAVKTQMTNLAYKFRLNGDDSTYMTTAIKFKSWHVDWLIKSTAGGYKPDENGNFNKSLSSLNRVTQIFVQTMINVLQTMTEDEQADAEPADEQEK